MFLRKKAQSTAEYAITIALVVAVTAGVLQVALKGAIRQKNKQALNYLLSAGNVTEFTNAANQGVKLFTQELRQTTINKDNFKDETILHKGGSEQRVQQQQTDATALSVETINATSTDTQ